MRIHATIAALALTLMAACAADETKDEAPAPEAEQEVADPELAAQYEQIPQAAIIRVRLDAAGEPTGEPELRLWNGDAVTSEAEVRAAFESGAAPETLVGSADELDQDSSTQAWYINPCNSCCNKGCGGGNHHKPKHKPKHHKPMPVYSPSLKWKGYRWDYGKYDYLSYNYGGYQYYCWNKGPLW